MCRWVTILPFMSWVGQPSQMWVGYNQNITDFMQNCRSAGAAARKLCKCTGERKLPGRESQTPASFKQNVGRTTLSLPAVVDRNDEKGLQKG